MLFTKNASLALLRCGACHGAGYRGFRRCSSCHGMTVARIARGVLLYWGEPLTRYHVTVRHVRRWKKMFELGLDRQSLLINLGGGVVCDIGGFAASTFMRGINFLNIPTTLLAQVDVSVGGKTGIDFEEIKNAIGVFKNPIGVVIDVQTLKTLPKRELVSAFGEIIKHGVISGREHFNLVTSKKPEEFNEQELIEIIKQSIKIS